MPSLETRDELLRQMEVVRAQLERLDAIEQSSANERHASVAPSATAMTPATMAVIEWDSQRRVRRWSAHAEALFGWKADEVQGRSWSDLGLVHEDDIELVQPISQCLLSGSADFNANSNRNRRKDGTVIVCEWFNSIVRDDDGRVLSLLSLVRDVTTDEQRDVAGKPRDALDAEWIDDAMQLVFRATARKTGDEFFRSVVLTLAEELQLQYAVLARIAPETPDQADVLAWVAGGEIQPNVSYQLAGAPCANVRNQNICVYNDRIQQRFPQDKMLVEMNAHCYAGTPIIGKDGQTLGILAVLDTQPREFGPEVAAQLELFSDRVSEELERIAVEEALRASESMYRNLFEMSPSAVLVIDEERVVFANPAALEMWETPRLLDLADSSVFELFSEDDQPHLVSCLEAAKSGEATAPVELRLPGERLMHVEFRASMIEFGERSAVLGMALDVTQRKRAETYLRESQTQYRNLLENMTDVVYRYEIKPEARFAFVSQSISEMTGYSPADFYKDPALWREVVHPDDIHFMESASESSSFADEPAVVRWRRRDGQLIWIEPRNVPIHDEHGQLVAIEGIARDVTRRHLAEQAEKESERRLHELQLAAGVGDFNWDMQTNTVQWSDSLFQLLGYQTRPIDYDFVRKFVFHPDDVDDIESWLEDCLDSGSDILSPAELRLVKKSGETIFARTVGVIERDEKGAGLKVYGTLQDVTRRRTAELDLLRANSELQRHREQLEDVVEQRTSQLSAAVAKTEEGEKRLSAILDNTSMLIGLCAPDGSVLRANRAVIETIGGEESDFIGKFLWETPDWPLEVRATVKEAFDNASKGQFARYELRQLRADGSVGILDFSISAIRDEDGATKFLIPEGRDITEQKAIERRLRLTQASVDNSGDAVFWVDENKSFYYVNDTACERLGYTRDELLALNVSDIDPLKRDGQIADVDGRLARYGLATLESYHQRKDGTTFPVDVAIRHLEFEGERFLIAIARDATERRRYEEELEDAIERATAADRLKTAFLANMSHELRTPLNSILGFSGILQQEISGQLNHEQKTQVAVVEQNAEHLLSLINNVLDISKIEAGQFEVCAAAYDVPASVARVKQMVEPLAHQAGLRLDVEFAADLSECVGDRLRFEQILINLLNNAIRFTPQGGVTLRGRRDSGDMCWDICDTGVGIRPEDLAKLFLPFQQLHSGIDRKHDGTGLGLAISKRLANLMGGDIEVDSVWGQGSTFRLRLPLHQSDAILADALLSVTDVPSPDGKPSQKR